MFRSEFKHINIARKGILFVCSLVVPRIRLIHTYTQTHSGIHVLQPKINEIFDGEILLESERAMLRYTSRGISLSFFFFHLLFSMLLFYCGGLAGMCVRARTVAERGLDVDRGGKFEIIYRRKLRVRA